MSRTVAIGVIAVAMAGALCLGGTLLVENASSHISAWVVTQNEPAGTALSASDIQQVNIPKGTDSFKVLTSSPQGMALAHAVNSGDVLRSDDFVTSTMVQVPVSFKVAPGLNANDSVDIYATDTSTVSAVNAVQGTELIARNVTVVSVGNPTVIAVPASQEPLWISLSSAGISLTAARSGGVGVPTTTHNYTPDQALSILSQVASQGGS
jgi:hypothetical protein